MWVNNVVVKSGYFDAYSVVRLEERAKIIKLCESLGWNKQAEAIGNMTDDV
jgi:hypothetical protein